MNRVPSGEVAQPKWLVSKGHDEISERVLSVVAALVCQMLASTKRFSRESFPDSVFFTFFHLVCTVFGQPHMMVEIVTRKCIGTNHLKDVIHD